MKSKTDQNSIAIPQQSIALYNEISNAVKSNVKRPLSEKDIPYIEGAIYYACQNRNYEVIEFLEPEYVKLNPGSKSLFNIIEVIKKEIKKEIKEIEEDIEDIEDIKNNIDKKDEKSINDSEIRQRNKRGRMIYLRNLEERVVGEEYVLPNDSVINKKNNMKVYSEREVTNRMNDKSTKTKPKNETSKGEKSITDESIKLYNEISNAVVSKYKRPLTKDDLPHISGMIYKIAAKQEGDANDANIVKYLKKELKADLSKDSDTQKFITDIREALEFYRTILQKRIKQENINNKNHIIQPNNTPTKNDKKPLKNKLDQLPIDKKNALLEAFDEKKYGNKEDTIKSFITNNNLDINELLKEVISRKDNKFIGFLMKNNFFNERINIFNLNDSELQYLINFRDDYEKGICYYSALSGNYDLFIDAKNKGSVEELAPCLEVAASKNHKNFFNMIWRGGFVNEKDLQAAGFSIIDDEVKVSNVTPAFINQTLKSLESYIQGQTKNISYFRKDSLKYTIDHHHDIRQAFDQGDNELLYRMLKAHKELLDKGEALFTEKEIKELIPEYLKNLEDKINEEISEIDSKIDSYCEDNGLEFIFVSQGSNENKEKIDTEIARKEYLKSFLEKRKELYRGINKVYSIEELSFEDAIEDNDESLLSSSIENNDINLLEELLNSKKYERDILHEELRRIDHIPNQPVLQLIKKEILIKSLDGGELTYDAVHKFCTDLVKDAFEEYKKDLSIKPEEAYEKAIVIMERHFGGPILTTEEKKIFKEEFLKPFKESYDEYNTHPIKKVAIYTFKLATFPLSLMLWPLGEYVCRGFKSKETSMINKVIKEMEKTITNLSNEREIKNTYGEVDLSDEVATFFNEGYINSIDEKGRIPLIAAIEENKLDHLQDIIFKYDRIALHMPYTNNKTPIEIASDNPEALSLIKEAILTKSLDGGELTYDAVHKFCHDLVKNAFKKYKEEIKSNNNYTAEEAYEEAIGIMKDHFGGPILTQKEQEEFKKEFLKPFNHANKEHQEWNNASILGKTAIMTRKILVPIGNIFRGFKSKETSMINKVIKEMEKTITSLSNEREIKNTYGEVGSKDKVATFFNKEYVQKVGKEGKTPLVKAIEEDKLEDLPTMLKNAVLLDIHNQQLIEIADIHEDKSALQLIKKEILIKSLDGGELTYNAVHKFCNDLVKDAFEEYKKNPSTKPEEAYEKAIVIMERHFGGPILTKDEKEFFKKEFLKPFDKLYNEHNTSSIKKAVLKILTLPISLILVPGGYVCRGFKSEETYMINRVIKEMEENITSLYEIDIKKGYGRVKSGEAVAEFTKKNGSSIAENHTSNTVKSWTNSCENTRDNHEKNLDGRNKEWSPEM